MKIGLYVNPDKDSDLAIARQAAKLVSQLGGSCLVGSQYARTKLAETAHVEIGEYAACDLTLSMGGDGTFLSAVHLPGCEALPIAGVNLGSVGFLPEIKPEFLEDSIQKIFHGQYQIDERMMLNVACFDPLGQLLEQGDALNDAVISRGGKSRILMLDLQINRELVERIPGDGIIVSTPTGSTAYSLSASGPIVHPDLMLMLITPICPHTLHNRSYIAHADSAVTIRICEYPYHAVLAIDGRKEIELASGCSIVIKRAQRSLKMLRLGEDRFYATLPQKIQARGKAN